MLRLGTKRHHDRLLAGIDSLEEVGCFGLTELGYGNNAVEMETTATYDPKTGKKFGRMAEWRFCGADCLAGANLSGVRRSIAQP